MAAHPSLATIYTSADATYLLLGLRRWRTLHFFLPSVRLGHGQNHKADFRFTAQGVAFRAIRVTTQKPEGFDATDRLDAAALRLVTVTRAPGMEVTFGNDANPSDAALFKALSVTSVESYVDWAGVEPERDSWDWSRWDKQVAVLQEAGLKWVPFLIAGPAYATPLLNFRTHAHWLVPRRPRVNTALYLSRETWALEPDANDAPRDRRRRAGALGSSRRQYTGRRMGDRGLEPPRKRARVAGDPGSHHAMEWRAPGGAIACQSGPCAYDTDEPFRTWSRVEIAGCCGDGERASGRDNYESGEAGVRVRGARRDFGYTAGGAAGMGGRDVAAAGGVSRQRRQPGFGHIGTAG